MTLVRKRFPISNIVFDRRHFLRFYHEPFETRPTNKMRLGNNKCFSNKKNQKHERKVVTGQRNKPNYVRMENKFASHAHSAFCALSQWIIFINYIPFSFSPFLRRQRHLQPLAQAFAKELITKALINEFSWGIFGECCRLESFFLSSEP